MAGFYRVGQVIMHLDDDGALEYPGDVFGIRWRERLPESIPFLATAAIEADTRRRAVKLSDPMRATLATVTDPAIANVLVRDMEAIAKASTRRETPRYRDMRKRR